MMPTRTVAAKESKPCFPNHVRLQFDPVRGKYAVLAPERVYWPDDVAIDVLNLCNGQRSLSEIAEALAKDYDAPVNGITADTIEFVQSWLDLGLLVVTQKAPSCGLKISSQKQQVVQQAFDLAKIEPPIAMLAELTHRCPLQCPYCSNPIHLLKAAEELTTQDWQNVFEQAADLGVLQVHLSGGEPTLRSDLEHFVRTLSNRGVYTNLITAGVTLTKERISYLADCGLDHVQLSMQAVDPQISDKIGNYKGSLEKKRAVAGWIIDSGLSLTINAPTHRHNIGQTKALIAMALELKAGRLEIAHVQYYGWAGHNKAALMPHYELVLEEAALVAEAQEQLRGILSIDYVTPDHYAQFPKPCMGGWAKDAFTITPGGMMLPCHAAESLGLEFGRVSEKSLGEIWYKSSGFNAFRGTEWMTEPCRSCPRKHIDFGGCRCQAFALTGNAAATDPACQFSPHHTIMKDLTEDLLEKPNNGFIYRRIGGLQG